MSSNNFNKLSNFTFNIDRMPTLVANIQSVNLPGMTIGERELPNRHTTYNVPGDQIIFDKLEIEFVVDEDLKSYQEAMDWLFSMRNPKSFAHADFYSDGFLTILSNNKNPLFTYVFRDCFPLSLTQLSFDVKDDDQEQTCNLTMSYSYFVLQGSDQANYFNPKPNGPNFGNGKL